MAEPNKEEIIFECAIDEYNRECERTDLLESKASYYIAVLIGVVTISITAMPYEEIKESLFCGNQNLGYFIVTTLCILAFSIYKVAYAFFHLARALGLERHAGINVEHIYNSTRKNEFDVMINDIIQHLIDNIDYETKINDKKCDNLKKATSASYTGIILIILITVTYNIIL